MTITNFQLKQIIQEEYKLAVEKQRLRDIINEEYRNVLQESAVDESFYKLIREAKPGTEVQLVVKVVVKDPVAGVKTVYKPGTKYLVRVLKNNNVLLHHEDVAVLFGEEKESEKSKEELIENIKEGGGPSKVVDFDKTTVKYPGKPPMTLVDVVRGSKKTLAKAPVVPVKKTAAKPPAGPIKKKAPAVPPKAKTPEAPPEKKANMVSGKQGDVITIPEGSIPGPDFYRMKDLRRAMHKDDERWYKDKGYAWAPRPGEEKGPPGWLGHVGRDGAPLQEQVPAPVDPDLENPENPGPPSRPALVQKKKEKGVLHFHHPKWTGWKSNGGQVVPTHKIDDAGASIALAAATPKAKAKPAPTSSPAKPAAKQKVASAPDVKDPIGTILGVLEKKFNQARAKGQKYEPNWSVLTSKFKLTDDQLEKVKNAYLELVTTPGSFEPTKTPASSPAPAVKPKKAASASTATAEPEGVNAWVGKSMRDVIKLTKAGLKKTLKRRARANNYGGDGWFKGGLLKIRRKHPLRRKYKAWYKWYYSAEQKKKRRAARKAKKR